MLQYAEILSALPVTHSQYSHCPAAWELTISSQSHSLQVSSPLVQVEVCWFGLLPCCLTSSQYCHATVPLQSLISKSIASEGCTSKNLYSTLAQVLTNLSLYDSDIMYWYFLPYQTIIKTMKSFFLWFQDITSITYWKLWIARTMSIKVWFHVFMTEISWYTMKSWKPTSHIIIRQQYASTCECPTDSATMHWQVVVPTISSKKIKSWLGSVMYYCKQPVQ